MSEVRETVRLATDANIVTATQAASQASAARVAAEAARDTADARASVAEAASVTAQTAKAAAEVSRQGAEAAEAAAVVVRDETAAILDYVAGGWWPTYDPATGEYDTDEVSRFVGARRDGLVYGVEAPKGAATACTKTGANAGVANPVPSVIGAPGSDPYLNRGPFFTIEANGYVDNAGWPHITALEGDANFSRTGSQDVWILTPVLWWRQVEASSTMTFEVSDSYRPGFELQPKAVLPDGRRRPFMLFAKYALSQVNGVARSVSGQQPLTSTVSHDSLITICKNATTGYSGKSYADDWYVKMMFLLKYANKSSQSVFAGVSSVSGGTVADLRATGTCDAVPGRDGAPTNPLDPTQPFVLQGIELMLGMYETLADVIFANTGDGWRPRLLLDSKFAATSVTAAYIDSGVEVPTTDSSWQYSLYPRSAGGLLFGDGLGGNATAGTGDGTYVNPASTIATRQWRGLGYLPSGGRAGLFLVHGTHSLGDVHWIFGSRLSGVGRAG